MATVQNTKSLSSMTVEVMKPGDKDKSNLIVQFSLCTYGFFDFLLR